MFPVPAAYLHDLSPFVPFLHGEGFGVRWYGLSYLAGFLAAYALIRAFARRGRSPLPPDQVGDFVLAAAIGTVIGGRLGYCLFYQPGLWTDFSDVTLLGVSIPVWGVLKIWDGGMASHGGIVGILLACIIFGRRRGVSSLHLLDLTALTGMIGVFFGRMANFINGELYGRPCSPDLPWAVKFPQEIRQWSAAKLADLAPVVEKLGVPPDQWRAVLAESPAGPIVRQTLGRIVDAVQRGQMEVAEHLRPLLTARHPSQVYEALLEGALLFAALMLLWRRPRKPGVIAGWFLVLYAVVRIIGEQFRMPDEHIRHLEYAAIGLTRGQLLSILMLAAGAVCLVYWSRRPAQRLGGWAAAAEPEAHPRRRQRSVNPKSRTPSQQDLKRSRP